MRPSDHDRLLTVEETARRLAVSPRAVRAWIASGRLASVLLSRRARRVPESTVASLVASATRGGAA